jgi:hypothetical protein
MDYLEGLTSSQVSKVKQKIELISDAHFNSTKEIAKAIYDIKLALIGEDEWTAFCESDAIGFGSRTIMDYARARDWLMGTEVPEQVIGKLSVRVMAKMAQLKLKETTHGVKESNDNEKERELFDQLEQRMMNGEVITQEKFSEAYREIVSSKPSKTTSKDKPLTKSDLVQEVTRLSEQTVRLNEELDFYKARCQLLESIQGVQLSEYVEKQPQPENPILKKLVSNKRLGATRGAIVTA